MGCHQSRPSSDFDKAPPPKYGFPEFPQETETGDSPLRHITRTHSSSTVNGHQPSVEAPSRKASAVEPNQQADSSPNPPPLVQPVTLTADALAQVSRSHSADRHNWLVSTFFRSASQGKLPNQNARWVLQSPPLGRRHSAPNVFQAEVDSSAGSHHPAHSEPYPERRRSEFSALTDFYVPEHHSTMGLPTPRQVGRDVPVSILQWIQTERRVVSGTMVRAFDAYRVQQPEGYEIPCKLVLSRRHVVELDEVEGNSSLGFVAETHAMQRLQCLQLEDGYPDGLFLRFTTEDRGQGEGVCEREYVVPDRRTCLLALMQIYEEANGKQLPTGEHKVIEELRE